MQTLVRKPAVAGLFYERDPRALRSQLEWCFTHRLGPGKLPEPGGSSERSSIGFVVPHAALNYSGPIAAHAYYTLAREKKPDTIVIIGPNHTGLGSNVAVAPAGRWETPLGSLEVDGELGEAVVEESEFAELDAKAHMFEHSIEVQLPFIQYIYDSEVRILPVLLWEQSIEVVEELGRALARAVKRLGRDVVVVATSNLSHYQPQRIAEEHDKILVERVVALDHKGLYETVDRLGVTMCGPGAVATLIVYAREMGAKRGELLAYATSGDITGDRSNVVGYAALRIY